MENFHFFIYAIAIWRISNLLVHEEGPWMIFEHLRLRLGLNAAEFPGVMRETDPPGKMPGTMFNCVWCMSIWIAFFYVAVYAINRNVAFWLALPFALSAVACLLDEWRARE